MSREFSVDAKSVEDLFRISSDHPCLNIPHYQRAYCWKELEITTLINDVEEARQRQAREYFIGPITVLMNLEKDRFEVIDGKQRLTTICLIINHISIQLVRSETIALRQQTKSSLIRRSSDDGEELILCHHRKSDREAFKHEFRSDRSTPLSTISEASRTIERSFSDTSDLELAEFLQYLCSKVICIYVECMDDTLTYQIFETLNDRGKGLSPVDLIRNKLFSNIPEGRLLEDAIGKLSILQEHMRRVPNGTSDTHLQNMFSILLCLKQNQWFEPKDLFPALKSHLIQPNLSHTNSTSSVSAKELSLKLISEVCSDRSELAYRRSVHPSCHGNDGSLERALNSFHKYKVLNTLLFALMSSDLPQQDVIKVINWCGALIKRTQILNMTISLYGALFNSLAHKLYMDSMPLSNFVSHCRADIFSFDENAKAVCNDEQFKQQIIAQPSVKEERAKDFFVSLFHLQHRTVEGVDINISLGRELHLEHILPQNFHEQNWGENFTPDTHNVQHKRFGYLLLLSGPRNRDADRMKFADKLKRYTRLDESQQHNPLWGVSLLDGFNDWTKHNIDIRQERIANEMVKLWNFS